MPRLRDQIYHLRALNKRRQSNTKIISEGINIFESPIDVNTVPDNDNASSAIDVIESSKSINIIDVDAPDKCDSSITSESANIIDAGSPDNCDSNIISKSTNIIDAGSPDNCDSNIISESSNPIDVKTPGNCNIISNIQKKRAELIDRIKSLPDNEIAAAYHLFQTMTYSDGKRKAKILSPYLVNKAKTFIMESLGQQHCSIEKMRYKIRLLERENNKLRKEKETTNSRVHSLTMKIVKGEEAKTRYIQKMRSVIRKKKDISPEQFKKGADKLIKANKKEYSPQFVQLVTELSNTGVISISSTVECTRKLYTFLTGKKPDKWISSDTISRWNQETAKLFVWKSLDVDKESSFFTYGIMADESTRGERKIFLVCISYWNNREEKPILTLASMKDIDRCTGFEVANVVLQTCNEYNLNPKKCNFWLTDNAAYMSGLSAGAVAGFNHQSQANAYRIPCGIHSVHIAISKFENEAFGKHKSTPASLFIEHPSNFLNLAYQLHDGYKDSDRDSPMNMKSSIIKSLYRTLLNYRLTQYQKPISTRWLYQLRTGEQYLERRDFHIRFVSWLIPELKKSKNIHLPYLKKWEVFQNWLQNPVLNCQIKCMVKFGNKFYAEVIAFLTGHDKTPRVMQNGTLVHLPSGNRAHELPDQILLWLGELQEISKSSDDYFAEEVEEMSNIIQESELQSHHFKLNRGVEVALESFSKWMECWIHLPLSICRLGGDYGPEFARAVASKILNHSFENELSWREESYAEFLDEDLLKGLKNSFGLFNALKEIEFRSQFLAFANSHASDLYKFPLVYDFVKYRIWSIVVHQQQLEGMFNKYDIKTDPNQTTALQEARMQLTCSTGEEKITREALKEVRRELREKNESKGNDIEEFGEEAAKRVLESYIVPKK